MKNIIIEYCLCIFHHENEFICENDRCFHNLNNVKSDEYEIDLHKKKVYIYYTYLILNESFSHNIFMSTLNIE